MPGEIEYSNETFLEVDHAQVISSEQPSQRGLTLGDLQLK